MHQICTISPKLSQISRPNPIDPHSNPTTVCHMITHPCPAERPRGTPCSAVPSPSPTPKTSPSTKSGAKTSYFTLSLLRHSQHEIWYLHISEGAFLWDREICGYISTPCVCWDRFFIVSNIWGRICFQRSLIIWSLSEVLTVLQNNYSDWSHGPVRVTA